jgi:hypothetical protein
MIAKWEPYIQDRVYLINSPFPLLPAISTKIAFEQASMAQKEIDPTIELKRLQIASKMIKSTQEAVLTLNKLKSRVLLFNTSMWRQADRRLLVMLKSSIKFCNVQIMLI